jgi:YbbR domain-containing protein
MIAFLRHLIFHDFLLKVFSLTLAVLIWLTIHFASEKGGSPVAPLKLPTHQRTFAKLPVMVIFAAEDVRTSKVRPSEVEVTLQGEAKLLDDLQNRDIRVMVDLTGIEAAHLRKRIEVSPPAGVTVVRVTPAEVEVIIPPKG